MNFELAYVLNGDPRQKDTVIFVLYHYEIILLEYLVNFELAYI